MEEHSVSMLVPRHWSEDLTKDPPRPDPYEILLEIHKGNYELKLTRIGYEKVNKPRFNRVLNSLFPKRDNRTKKGRKHGKV